MVVLFCSLQMYYQMQKQKQKQKTEVQACEVCDLKKNSILLSQVSS